MAYGVTVYDINGGFIAGLGNFGTVDGARQAMLDHAKTTELPNEEPWHSPECNVLEGWFIGKNEYLIERPLTPKLEI